jgi:signal transduction histidine kinase
MRLEIPHDDLPMTIGRSVGCGIRLDDSEVSRQHAKLISDGTDLRILDLGSANGTRVNGDRISDARLEHGDSIRLGTTQLTYQLSPATDSGSVTASQVQIIDDASSCDPSASAIVQEVHADSLVSSGVWPDHKLSAELLYQVAEELVRPVHTLESLLQRVLELVLKYVRADRGCVLLKEAIGDELTPIVFCQRKTEGIASQQMLVSRSITGHVLKYGQAVRTTDALHDTRFAGGNSIVSSGVREAICAPMRGHEELLGVMYIDITTDDLVQATQAQRLTDEHLKAVLAVSRQSALAVEARRFQEAFLKAERLAAMGQTIAVLSHHIKNILQGMRGGNFLIQSGLDQTNNDLVRQGWEIVERNQSRIYDLVTDMLSFSKERVPKLEPSNLNNICAEVAELAESRAEECGVNFTYQPQDRLPAASFDREAIHRAVLNIVTNAIDAVYGSDDGNVVLQTGYDAETDMMIVAVCDNGPGIPEDQRATVFNVFESSKGSRGTGIGLPVSRKIIREHGGRIRIESEPGEGTRFVLSWPKGTIESQTIRLGSKTMIPDPSLHDNGSSINQPAT